MSRQKDISGSMGVPWLLFLIATLLSITLLTSPAAAANFGAKADVGTLSEPNAVASGDFDADGDNDLVFVNLTDNTVKFLKGDGVGGFSAPWSALDVTLGGGSGPFAVAVADFDGGSLDIAVVNIYSNNVSIYHGNGDGTFSLAAVYDVGPYPTSIVAANFNAQAKSDLAVTNYGDDSVSVLINNGSGVFAEPVGSPFATGAGPFDVKAGIFTASGDLDLIVANSVDNTVSILTGNGDGTFDAKSDKAVGTEPSSLATGDFDGDGNMDIAVANSASSNVSVLLGAGNGTFAAAVNYDVGFEPISIASGDFNGTTGGGGDGFIDLVVANRGDDNITMLRNMGGANVADSGKFEFAANYLAGTGPSSIIAVDLNGDSLPDIVTANRFGNNASRRLGQSENDAPIGSISIDQGNWTNTNTVDLTISSADESGGAVNMCVQNTASLGALNACLGTDDWEVVGNKAAWALTAGDGLKTVYVWFKDARNNISSTPYTDVILVDSSTPGKPIIINGDADYTNDENVTLTLAGGTATHYQKCNSAGCTDPDPAGTWTAKPVDWSSVSHTLASPGTDGTKTVCARFKDANDGDAVSAEFCDIIILDKTAPVPGTIVIEDGRTATLSTSVNLTLSASDSAGGAVQMCISNTNGPVDKDTCTDGVWEAFSASKAAWTLTAGEGTKTVYAWFKDARNNISSGNNDTIAYYTSAPTGSIVINSGALSTSVLAATLTLTSANGAIDMCVSEGNTCSVWIPVASSLSWNLSGPVNTEGTRTVNVWFRNEYGLVSDKYSDSIIYDKTAPTGTITIDEGDKTASTTAHLTLTSSDNLTSVTQMCISKTNTCSDWVIYNATPTVSLNTGDGSYTIYVWFRDVTGNTTAAPVTDTVVLDTTVPTITSFLVNDGDTNTFSGTVNLTIAATDGTGVGNMQMCVTNSAALGVNNVCPGVDPEVDYWEAFGSPKNGWSLDISGGTGSKSVYVWVKDELGNISLRSTDDIYYYASGPTGSIAINGGNISTSTLNVTYNLTSSVGVTLMCISTSNSQVCPAVGATSTGWVTYNATLSGTDAPDLDVTGGNGTKTVYAWFKVDANTAASAEFSDTIVYDTTEPDVNFVKINDDAATTGNAVVELTFDVTDALSSVTEMCLSETNTCTNWIPYVTPKSFTLTGGDGTKDVYAWFRDTLGNTTVASTHKTIVLDTTAPTISSFLVNEGNSNTLSGTVNLTIAATDGTGVGNMQMCVTNSAALGVDNACPGVDPLVDYWEALASPKNGWSLDISGGTGSKTVYVWVKDELGNISLRSSDAIYYYASGPTGSIAINGGNISTNSLNVTYNLTSSVGVTLMCISTDNGEVCPAVGATSTGWVTYNATLSGTDAPDLDVTGGNGTKTVYAWFKVDANTAASAEFSDTIVYDTTEPDVNFVKINDDAATTGNAVVELTFDVTDALSSVTEMCLSETNTCTNWIPYVTTKSFTLTGGDGTKDVYAWFRDILGNTTAAPTHKTIVLDTTAPTGPSVLINADDPATNSSVVTLTLAANDANSIAEVCLSNTNDAVNAGNCPGSPKLALPKGMAIDSSGNIYVADTGNHRIQKFSSAGMYLAGWGASGSGNGQFNAPRGIAMDSSGNVYVADTGNNRIQKFDSSGAYLAKWGTFGTGNGQFDAPKGVAVDSSGNVYVADTGNDRIQKFNASGAYLSKWGTLGTGNGQFQDPAAVAIDSFGNIYVADTGNNRMQKFSSTAVYQTKWGTTGTGDSQFDVPMGLAIDSSSNIYVADMNNNRIQKFNAAGVKAVWVNAAWGTAGSGDGELDTVTAIGVDSSGNIYAADTDNNRIQKFDSSADYLTQWGSSTGWMAYAAEKTWALSSGDGTKDVYAWFKDEYGYVSSGATDSIILDTTAPSSGSISINSGATTTNVTTFDLALSAVDSGSGLDVMCISTSNSVVCPAAGATSTGWITYAITFSSDPDGPMLNSTSSGDGTKTVYAWFRDVVGNVSAVSSDTVVLDTTAPTGSITINNGDASTASSTVSLSLSASGATQMCILNTNLDLVDTDTCTGGAWEAFATSKLLWSHAGGSDGTKTVYIWFKDAIGNVNDSPYSDTIEYDTAAPTGGTIAINGDLEFTKSTTVTLALSATDASPKEMCISNASGCSAWIAYAASKTWTLSTGAGLKTVYVKFRDTLGHTTDEITATITLDTTVPTNGTVTATNGDGSVSLSWTGFADAGSGLASYKVVSSALGATTAPANCSGTALYEVNHDPDKVTPYTYTHDRVLPGDQANTLPDGTYYYRVCAIDKAVNMSSGTTASARSVSEVDGPDVTLFRINTAPNDVATKVAAVTLNMTATDVTGPIQVCVSNTNSLTACTAWVTVPDNTPTTKTWTLSASNGTKTVYAWFKDSLNNITAINDTIIYDTTAPTNGTVVATPLLNSIKLDWSGFSDGVGSGILKYALRGSTTSVPTSCTTGTLVTEILASADPTYTHTTFGGNPLVNGTKYYYRLCAIDNLGYTSTGATATAAPTPETGKPSGSFTISTVNNNSSAALYTNKTAVFVHFSVHDLLTKDGFQICVSNSATCSSYTAVAGAAANNNDPVTGVKSWSLSTGNGLKTVNVWFKDKNGNISDPVVSQTITLDATLPTNGTLNAVVIDSQNDLTWNGFNDVGTSVASYKLVYSTTALPASCTATTATQLYAGTDTNYSHVNVTNGTTYYYRVCAIDQAGNLSTGATLTARWVPETTPPDGSVSINGGAGYTGTNSVTLTLSATDDSTVTQMCISNTTSCSTWVAYATSKTWTLSGTSATRTVNVWFRDQWSNTSTMKSDSIGVDAVKPVNGTVTATGGSGEVSLSWSGFSDAASGLASYKIVSSTTATPTTCTGAGIYTGPTSITSYVHTGLLNAKKYYYRVCAVDNVGNMSSGTTKYATTLAQ